MFVDIQIKYCLTKCYQKSNKETAQVKGMQWKGIL